MINIKYPISDSFLYTDKVHIDYVVENNSEYTSKIVFILDGVKYEKTELFGSFVVNDIGSGQHILKTYLVNKYDKIIVGSEKKIKFTTDNSLIFLRNRLSTVVSSQLPSFIRDEYSMFVTFIEKYYEFLEQTNDPTKVPFAQTDFFDADYTPEILLKKFKKLFIPDFPEELTVDIETGEPLNIRNLIKRAVNFYQSKGTEKSLNFVFKVLFDRETELFYPRSEMMIASGGLWLENKTLKVFSFVNEDKIRALVGNIIYQKDQNGRMINRARVSSCSMYIQSPYKVAELVLEEISGVFVDGDIYCDLIYQDAQDTFVFTLRRGIQTITCQNKGSNYKVGDLVKLVSNGSSSGVGYSGIVSQIDLNGGILAIRTANFGINYEQNVTGLYSIQIQTDGGTGFSGVASSTVLCSYDGYYKNSKSVLGAKNFLQDNYYYQTHSYEIRTDIPFDNYKDSINRLVHPAGYKMFGKIILKPSFGITSTTANNIIQTTSNFIGNYLPYRLSSEINLRDENEDLFPEGFNPDQPITDQTGTSEFVHDVNNSPITISVKNAIYSLEETLPDVSDIYQKNNYWVVFPHPNSVLNTNRTIGSFLDMTIEELAINSVKIKAGDEF